MISTRNARSRSCSKSTRTLSSWCWRSQMNFATHSLRTVAATTPTWLSRASRLSSSVEFKCLSITVLRSKRARWYTMRSFWKRIEVESAGRWSRKLLISVKIQLRFFTRRFSRHKWIEKYSGLRQIRMTKALGKWSIYYRAMTCFKTRSSLDASS